MAALIWSPFDTPEQVRKIAVLLIEERLVACVNIVPGIISLFEWQGRVEESQECGALFKTHDTCLKQAVARLEELHPYETPAIFGWHCDEAAPMTKIWLGALHD